MSKKSPILELKNISKDYKQPASVIEVLKDFSLEVFKGEIIAIVGASGTGKSTLLHIAGLLDSDYSGNVIIEGEEISKNENIRTRIRKDKIGFIYQYHHLLKDFSARENVAMPRLISKQNYLKGLEDADELLKEFGLDKRSFNFPGELSGGQQQRVAVARALINNPQIILADEPTGNLDSESAKNVIDIISKSVKAKNICAIIVTHNEKIAKLADRIITLQN